MSQPINLYHFHINKIGGRSALDLKQFKGKKVLIVNTASQCGYTPQYAQLQELHLALKKDIVIIACPCNDFGNQEPDTEDNIQHFCQVNYGVSFPLTEKVKVKGEEQHPLFQWLANTTGVAPQWNFHKYIINEQGEVTHQFPSSVSPLDEEVLTALGYAMEE